MVKSNAERQLRRKLSSLCSTYKREEGEPIPNWALLYLIPLVEEDGYKDYKNGAGQSS